MELLRAVVAMALSVILPLVVQLWDLRRGGVRRPSPWGYSTWGAVLGWLGPFAMLGWSWHTRGRVWRLFWGPLWLAVIILVMNAADMALEAASGAALEDPGEVISGTLFIVPLGVLVQLMVWGIKTVRRFITRRLGVAVVIAVVFLVSSDARALERIAFDRDHPLPPGPDGWSESGAGAIRGITVGPIENALHPGVGYGTARGRDGIVDARRMGASWIALTPFGRVGDLAGRGVDLTFEADAAKNSDDVLRAIRQAHEEGLRVFLVPHLWVESGGWRALIDPDSDEGWVRWAASYRRFLLHWADIAERGRAEMLSVGVELRSWVTSPRAASFVALIGEVRSHYAGLLTYSANWDDVENTVILGDLDVIGINAFFPLTEKEDARLADLVLGGERVAADLAILAHDWHKPVLLTEMGYTNRADPALRPWEWPDDMEDVDIDEAAQAVAYRALLAPLVDAPWCAGFFVWRTYSDPDDVSQEAEWGFSPRGKLAELELRDAFSARWAADGPLWAPWLGAHRARTPGIHAWELSPRLFP